MFAGRLVLAFVTGFAAEPPRPGGDGGPFVGVGTRDERPVGRLAKLTVEGTAELDTSAGRVAVRDLISLRRAAVALPAYPRGAVLMTTTGDRVAGRVVGGDGQSLRFRPGYAEVDWDVPLTAVAVVWFAHPPADTPADPGRYPWLAGPRKRDVLRFPNGDTAAGTLDGFAADPVTLRFKPVSGDVRTIPLADVAAVAFDPVLARARRPKGAYARVVLRDGSRLDVTAPTADADTLTAKTLFGQAVAVPVVEVVSLDVIRGKATDLADLKPKAVEQAGFLGAAWPWAANRSVRGAPIQLLTSNGIETFDRGLGTHPRTVLTYDLGGRYRRFEAVVGLDAATGGRGRATLRVLIDGKEQPFPDLLKLAAGPAVAVRADVAGGKELTLVVDYGPAGDVQADVNWADARLIE